MAIAGSVALLDRPAQSDGTSSVGAILGTVGLVGIGFGAPVVDLAHGRWGAALASFGMRLTAVLVGAGVGLGVSSHENGILTGDGLLSGGVTAGCLFFASSVVDAAFLAYEPVDAPTDQRPSAAHFSVAPQVGVVRGGATVGLGGSL